MLDFDKPSLARRVGTLPMDGQLAFLLLLCERQMPALREFARETGLQASIYETSLDLAWKNLAGAVTEINWQEMAETCFDSAPDTEDYTHDLTSAALDTALSVGLTMEFIADRDIDHVVEAAYMAYGTADLYADGAGISWLRLTTLEGLNERRLVQQELRQQQADLEFVESLKTDSPEE